jgi:hypothetical protein
MSPCHENATEQAGAVVDQLEDGDRICVCYLTHLEEESNAAVFENPETPFLCRF